MTNLGSKRADVKGKMRVVKRGADELVTQFADKSYAVIKGGHFVPLVPRHMSHENWQELFWLGTQKVVVNGQAYKSLCSICMNALECMLRKDQFDFRCVCSPKTITIDLRKRRRRKRR